MSVAEYLPLVLHLDTLILTKHTHTHTQTHTLTHSHMCIISICAHIYDHKVYVSTYTCDLTHVLQRV